MGSGIAQVSAASGILTSLYDINETVITSAKQKFEAAFQTLVDKQKIPAEEKNSILKKINFISDIRQCVADLVIEAIAENLDSKTALFRRLSEINSNDTIFATNTSSLSVSRIAADVSHPERIAGMHFFNPAPVMLLVEIVKAAQTSEYVIERLVALAKQLRKVPVVCRDVPGFIVNRVARPYYIESLRLAEEGIADFESIDRVLEARGFKLGPFKLMDLIGNDVNYMVSCSVYEQLLQPERLKPSYIQKQKVEKGEFGRKTGKGYYNY
ncbi:MAG: 3-hydroxybutyryl-CoA dehydrogenase [Chitinophagaceae bacterium]|nr:3-hydroxybutyryl-CoA dehydrogenase [Chitinophagaceae bacterium]